MVAVQGPLVAASAPGKSSMSSAAVAASGRTLFTSGAAGGFTLAQSSTTSPAQAARANASALAAIRTNRNTFLIVAPLRNVRFDSHRRIAPNSELTAAL